MKMQRVFHSHRARLFCINVCYREAAAAQDVRAADGSVRARKERREFKAPFAVA